MKAERESDRWFAPAAAGVSVVAGAAVGGAALGIAGAAAGLAAGGAIGWTVARGLSRRTRARRRALATPFPERWRRYLLERYDHYERMDEGWRARFEADLRIFLAEQRITGIGVDVTDELRLLVAASAITLSVGWPDYEWDQLTEVLLYPDDFDRDWRVGDAEDPDRAGETHPWGTIILSVPSLEESFDDPDDAFHVGIHEFAHLLDVEHSRFDGIPPGLSGEAARAWTQLAEREMDRMRKGRSVLDDYGADEPAEFFACAVEGFFEASLALRQRHRELYDALRAYFGQDPAAWDDARGLEL